MAKRTIEGYRPVGIAKALEPGHRYISEASIEKLIEIVGALPDRMFEITSEVDGRQVETTVTAREKFERVLESAAVAYHWEAESQLKPTAKQLAAEFKAIGRAATRLLRALQVDSHCNMPYALRYDGGLEHFAEEERRQVKVNAVHDHSLGASRFREAVEGVAALERWAGKARARKLASAQREVARRAVKANVYARNEGDKPLNEYLHRVVENCWVGVLMRDKADGPSLIAFAQEAARAIGVKISKDGTRERLRRALKWRTRKSKSK